MRSLKVSGIIHLFAVLHAVVALSCHLAGINDELVLTLLGFVFLLPLIATCIWALVDLIRLLVMSDAEFDAKYNNR